MANLNLISRNSRAVTNLAARLAGGLLVLLLSLSVWADSAGTVTHLSGILSARKADGGSRLLSVKSDVMEGETLVTEEGAYARVKFKDGAEIVLRPKTQMRVDQYHYVEGEPAQDSVLMALVKGGMRAVTGLLGKRNPEKISVHTTTATIGIRGTDWGALFCQDDCGSYHTNTGQPPQNGLYLDVVSGRIVATNTQGSQEFTPGQFGFVGINQPPIIVPPSQGIQVTMPPSIAQNNTGGNTLGTSRDAAQCSVQ